MSFQNFKLTSAAYVSKTFDLNDITFGRVVKFSILFHKFGLYFLICMALGLMTSYETNQYRSSCWGGGGGELNIFNSQRTQQN